MNCLIVAWFSGWVRLLWGFVVEGFSDVVDFVKQLCFGAFWGFDVGLGLGAAWFLTGGADCDFEDAACEVFFFLFLQDFHGQLWDGEASVGCHFGEEFFFAVAFGAEGFEGDF